MAWFADRRRPRRLTAHLRHILKSYAAYYNCVRTHRSLHKDAPVSRSVQRSWLIATRASLADFTINIPAFNAFGTHSPWDAVTEQTRLTGVRLHDLRHTYASFGAGGGLGLPIIGRLLGHSQAATTARYAHLDNDPLRRASEAIAGRIAAALDGRKTAPIVPLSRKHGR